MKITENWCFWYWFITNQQKRRKKVEKEPEERGTYGGISTISCSNITPKPTTGVRGLLRWITGLFK
jgi:hypothetical protein